LYILSFDKPSSLSLDRDLLAPPIHPASHLDRQAYVLRNMGAAQSILNDKADTEFAVGVSLAVTTFAAIGALIGSISIEILKGRAVLLYVDGAVSLLGLVGTLG
jgi:hypothetical protein